MSDLYTKRTSNRVCIVVVISFVISSLVQAF